MCQRSGRSGESLFFALSGCVVGFESRVLIEELLVWVSVMLERGLIHCSIQGGVPNRMTSRSKYGTKKPKPGQ